MRCADRSGGLTFRSLVRGGGRARGTRKVRNLADPGLRLVVGTGFEPATSGEIGAIPIKSECLGEPRIPLYLPAAAHRASSLTREVSGRGRERARYWRRVCIWCGVLQ